MLNDYQKWLLEALSLAEKGEGFTHPNPPVGAILVRGNTILGSGFHKEAGSPHAEVHALSQIKEAPRDATLYVTLEPCNHWGKTPPCTDLLIQKKVRRVVYSERDSNPVVSGKTARLLEAHGIEVLALSVPEIHKFYERYRYWNVHKKPWVTLKIAVSKDGYMAKGKTRLYLTGPECEILTHTGRKKQGALLTTSNTVLLDNPQFNVRLNSEILSKPVFILNRSNHDLDQFQIKHLNKNVTELKFTDWHQNLEAIAKMGFYDVWVEVGPRFSTFLLENNLVQQLVVFHSEVMVCNSDSPNMHAVIKRFQKSDSFSPLV